MLPPLRPAAPHPYPTADNHPHQHDCHHVLLHVAEKRLQEVTEKITGTADDRCPEEGAAEVEQHEAAGVEAAGADDDGGDGAHAVDETKAEHGNGMIPDEKTADPVNLRIPFGPLCQNILAVALAELEEKLVGAKSAAEDDADHPPQLHIAAVGEAAGDYADYAPFHKGADPQGRIAVGADEWFQVHAITLSQKCARRLQTCTLDTWSGHLFWQLDSKRMPR